MGISFELDISASELSGNNTFFIIGKDRSTYTIINDISFSGFVQQLYYQVGDTIDISFNSNTTDISFIIFDSSNIQETKFIFDKNNPKYTISFENYSDYRFGFLQPDGSFNKYGIFNSYILKADTRDDLNSYISSKYNASDKRNRLQQFNRDDRRFIGNYDYIKSDATRIGVDSSGVNNDLIIQSVTNDIHIVTGEKQRTSIWGNLDVHGNINMVGDSVILGVQGILGPQGIQGPSGEQGIQGPAGADGSGINIDCLTSISKVNVILSDGFKYVFNGNNTYESKKIYGLAIGNYVFQDISSSHPMALLNNDVSNLISYSGSILAGSKDVSGISYDFYYGDINVNVIGDFGELSVYCLIHNYMGGENLLKYSTLCQITNLTGYEDASFTNVDISGSLILNNIDISGKLSQIDASLVDLASNSGGGGGGSTGTEFIRYSLTGGFTNSVGNCWLGDTNNTMTGTINNNASWISGFSAQNGGTYLKFTSSGTFRIDLDITVQKSGGEAYVEFKKSNTTYATRGLVSGYMGTLHFTDIIEINTNDIIGFFCYTIPGSHNIQLWTGEDDGNGYTKLCITKLA